MRPAVFLAVAVLAALARPAVADVGAFLGKPVVSVALEVEGRPFSDPALIALIETRVGEPLSMRAVRESLTHLYLLQRYEDVQVAAAAAPGGVRLTYGLEPVHPVNRIAFEGTLDGLGIDQGRLRRIVVDRYGPSPPPGRRYDLARLVEEELARAGYLHAVCTPRVDEFHRPDRATLVLNLQPGVRTLIGAVTVEGTPGTTPAEFLDRVSVKTGDPYTHEAIDARLLDYQRRLTENGYVEARATMIARVSDDGQRADLTLNAVQGPHVRVDFRGDPIDRDRQEALVPIKEERSADEDLLEDASNDIEAYLRGLGYRDARAPHTRDTTGSDLVITFTIARGRVYRVSEVEVAGASEPLSALEPRFRTRRGQPFAQAALDADLVTIRDFYHRRGFAALRVETSIVPGPAGPAGEIPVAVRIAVNEGVRTVVGSISIRGASLLSERELLDGLSLQPGRPFFVTQVALDRDTLQLAFLNHGYENATVDGNPGVSADGSRADVVFTVNAGPQLTVDHVLIVGNERTRAETIARAVQLKPGDPLGLSAIVEAQRRVTELGLFRRVRLSQSAPGDDDKRDLVVTVEESPVTTIGYGGGLESFQLVRKEAASGAAVARLNFAPRVFFEIGRRNLFGKNRSINLFTRLSLRPDPAQSTSDHGRSFNEYRVYGTFREPRLFNTSVDAFLIGTFEQQGRPSFTLARRSFSAEAGRPVTRRITMSGNYQLQRTELFNATIADADKLLVDRLFPQIVLSSFSLSGVQSTRDDALSPTRGHLLSLNGQVAARHIGSEVGFFRSYLTGQSYRTLPSTHGTVLATSVRLGTAYGFPRTVSQLDALGQVVLNPDGSPATTVVRDLPASERFFAGGDTTVRGFALDQLGTPATIDANGFAFGGNAVLILNGELRVPLSRNVGVVGFVDAGNVFARTVDIDLGQLRSAAGFGVRYRSPIGPIRVDIGYKLRRHEVVPGRLESASALHISLGQAF